jgi:hypothetical protein
MFVYCDSTEVDVATGSNELEGGIEPPTHIDYPSTDELATKAASHEVR